jgi:FkbM family methyltransferase
VPLNRKAKQPGALQRELPFFKDIIDYRLSRHPRLYLLVERFRGWVNWDKRVYLSFVRPGDTVLDVGANVGAHAIFLSHLVRGAGRVLAFEPLAPNVDALGETIRRRARTDNVTIFPLAVGNPGNARHEVVISAPGDDLTQASLHLQAAGSWARDARVREFEALLTSLDAESAVNALASIDFMKIDVEGGELDVLKGASRILARHRPLIYCEMSEEWAGAFGYAPQDLFKFVRSLGYREARLFNGERVSALALDTPLPHGFFRTPSNVLFLADNHADLVADFDNRYVR